MARPARSQPTDGELELLQILWTCGPSELGRICDTLRRHRPAATTTVATMLGVMHKKGLVKRTSGPRAYLWSAKISQRSAARGFLNNLVNNLFQGSARRLVAHLLEEGDLNPRDQAELRRLLNSQTKKNKSPVEGKP